MSAGSRDRGDGRTIVAPGGTPTGGFSFTMICFGGNTASEDASNSGAEAKASRAMCIARSASAGHTG